ncbi:MAG TPA: xylulokinase [Cyclobacteriaceae bacterium]
MYTLGVDLGSSSVKISLFDVNKGRNIYATNFPKEELVIKAPQPGWAEQDPEVWWESFKMAWREAIKHSAINPKRIEAIGISYQMHGLVILDKAYHPIRPSIMWCDSRAVDYGRKAEQSLGIDYCTSHLLNSPGNFTASKLKWVQSNEPEHYHRIYKFMLPGDYLAFRLSRSITTTNPGLSEGIFWDFKEGNISQDLLKYYELNTDHIPEVVSTFNQEVRLSQSIANELGLKENIPISYRAGDQPNNAFSLNALNPGEVAATAGTSGVIYAVTNKPTGDRLSRVNTFLHVTNSPKNQRNGVLLCINGTGILNNWLRKNVSLSATSYDEINKQASATGLGADGLIILPFGNGSERVLNNQLINASILGLDFNRHTRAHLYRAAQEGIVFALQYGFEVLNALGVSGDKIRAGYSNMFRSSLFREIFVNTTNTALELYDTDGAEGAARGAAYGAGLYNSLDSAFNGLQIRHTEVPKKPLSDHYQIAYNQWKTTLEKQLKN